MHSDDDSQSPKSLLEERMNFMYGISRKLSGSDSSYQSLKERFRKKYDPCVTGDIGSDFLLQEYKNLGYDSFDLRFAFFVLGDTQLFATFMQGVEGVVESLKNPFYGSRKLRRTVLDDLTNTLGGIHASQNGFLVEECTEPEPTMACNDDFSTVVNYFHGQGLNQDLLMETTHYFADADDFSDFVENTLLEGASLEDAIKKLAPSVLSNGS